MFEIYRKIFDARGELYNRACRRFSQARSEESRLMLERLRLAGGADCGTFPPAVDISPTASTAPRTLTLRRVCMEPSAVFARDIAQQNAVLIARPPKAFSPNGR